VALGLVIVLGAAACRPEPKLQVTTALANLAHPWDLAFDRNGDMYFTERFGRINRLSQGHRTPIIVPADVQATGEGGMMGIALDPSFGTSRVLYTCFRSNAGGALDIRIVRWQLNPAKTRMAKRRDILTGIPTNPTGRHSGCRIRFGPDHALWVGTGDAATGTNPQSPTSLGGKVLRITSFGRPAAGNMGPPFRPEIYNYGHRNVQGIAFGPGGRAYDIEHGPDRDDEVNLLVRGGNYGWDPVPGYNESVPMTDLGKFPNARRAVWSSGSPTIAPSGGTFLTGSRWKGWNGALAIAVLKGQQLRVLAFNANGTAVEQQWARVTGHGRLRSAVLSARGNLYIATDAQPGRILRVIPTG